MWSVTKLIVDINMLKTQQIGQLEMYATAIKYLMLFIWNLESSSEKYIFIRVLLLTIRQSGKLFLFHMARLNPLTS